MLKLEDWEYHYAGGAGIAGISFQAQGVLGVVGDNGAGKTTLFNSLAGLLLAQGRAVFQGRPLEGREGLLAYLPSFEFYYRELSGRENWQALGRVCRHDKDYYRRFLPLAEELGLAPHLDKPFGDCSLGMRKKLQFVGTLFSPAELFLFDEPHNGVDLRSNLVLNRELRRLADEGHTVLFSSHILENLKEVSDSILWLHQGRVEDHFQPPFGDLATRILEMAQ